MRILVAHNHYAQRGGEDTVFENEVRLLRAAGHEVHTVEASNADVVSWRQKAQAFLGAAHNRSGAAAVAAAVLAHRSEVVHFHNVFPLFSPAAYGACRLVGAAVVQTLHNYRPVCLGSLLLRDGMICRQCVGHSPLPGVAHRCYRGSLIASAAAGHMLAVHRGRGTWWRDVDRYIALTAFSRDIFVGSGFPSGLIEIKPNFLGDPGPTPGGARSGVLYVGRLSAEKGVATLLEACAGLDCEVRIAGTGPAEDSLRAASPANAVFLGALGHAAVLEEMRRACAVVLPSIWFEAFPMIIVEAFACGTPVIASRLGALAEIVEDGGTGALSPPGDAAALRTRIQELTKDPGLAAKLGKAARAAYLARYTPEANLPILERIYAAAVSARRGHAAAGRPLGAHANPRAAEAAQEAGLPAI
jgi:glycosyltransferase involved in cell wall biosynthesis